ncbi:MAG: hypothetical protein QOI06_3440 [Nocardioidaceae bacterium]|nr:hypothetical protein [Nocardioidaceae bacterium]
MYVDDLPRTHDARFLAVFLVAFVAVLAAVYALGYAVAGDKVPTGTKVSGVDIGGMTRAHAARVLEHRLAPGLTRPVTVTVAGHQATLSPAKAGFALDVNATLDSVMDGSDWNPSHMLKVIEGGGHVDAVYSSDPEALAAALAPLAANAESHPVSSTVVVRGGRPVIRAGHPGHRVDVAAARDELIGALRDGDASVSLKLIPVPPPIGVSEVDAFVAKTLRPALSRAVVVSVSGRPLTVTPVEFGPALRIEQSDGRLRLGVFPGDLFRRTRGILRSAPGRPQDARIAFRAGRPVVVPGRAGRQVNIADWAKAVLTAATVSRDRRASAKVSVVSPAFTTADARALDIKAQIGAGSAHTDKSLSSILRAAARNIDATVVLPGATFSYLRSSGGTGPSTVRSPLADVTAAAATRARMKILERPAGPSSGHDLQFRNSSDFPVYVRALVISRPRGPATVEVQLWSAGG